MGDGHFVADRPLSGQRPAGDRADRENSDLGDARGVPIAGVGENVPLLGRRTDDRACEVELLRQRFSAHVETVRELAIRN